MLSKTSASSTEGKHVLYRDFHQARADERRQALMESLNAATIDSGYARTDPDIRLGLPFKPIVVSEDWFDWPALPDLFPASFPGVKTSRDSFLVDIDPDRLKTRVADYFDGELSHEEIARRYPGVMQSTARFNARAVRNALLVPWRTHRKRYCSATPTGLLTPAGSIGKRRQNCLTKSARNTGRMCSRGTCLALFRSTLTERRTPGMVSSTG